MSILEGIIILELVSPGIITGLLNNRRGNAPQYPAGYAPPPPVPPPIILPSGPPVGGPPIPAGAPNPGDIAKFLFLGPLGALF